MIFSIFWFTIMAAATHYATPVRVVDSGSVGGDQNRDKKDKTFYFECCICQIGS